MMTVATEALRSVKAAVQKRTKGVGPTDNAREGCFGQQGLRPLPSFLGGGRAQDL